MTWSRFWENGPHPVYVMLWQHAGWQRRGHSKIDPEGLGVLDSRAQWLRVMQLSIGPSTNAWGRADAEAAATDELAFLLCLMEGSVASRRVQLIR